MVSLCKDSNSKFWRVAINPDIKSSKKIKWTKGIIRHFGKAKNGLYKISYVEYPKSNFTKEDMNRIVYIDKKYKDCPLCKIGVKTLNLKYSKNNNKIMKKTVLLNKFNKMSVTALAQKIKGGRLSPLHKRIVQEWSMQGLSALLSNVADYGVEPSAKKIIDLIIGLGGTAGITYLFGGNKYANLRNELLTFFANWGTRSLQNIDNLSITDGIYSLRSSFSRTFGNGFAGMPDFLGMIMDAKNMAKLGLGKFVAMISNLFKFSTPIGIKGRFREVPTTHGGKVFGSFSTQEAGDYGYDITSTNRFRESSKFSPNFMNRSRFKQSGDAHY